MTFECMGADLGGDDCLVDAVIEIMDLGDGAEAVEFVEAEASLDEGGREQIAEAGLRCQGASAEVAACVTDAMREEFGDDVFESRTGPGLSADGQQRIGALISDCSTGTSEPGGPGASEWTAGPTSKRSARHGQRSPPPPLRQRPPH